VVIHSKHLHRPPEETSEDAAEGIPPEETRSEAEDLSEDEEVSIPSKSEFVATTVENTATSHPNAEHQLATTLRKHSTRRKL
jgi:hypothetical protein